MVDKQILEKMALGSFFFRGKNIICRIFLRRCFMNLKQYIDNSNDKDLFHMNLEKMQNELKIDKMKLLDIMIEGLFEGLLMIEWVYHCPHCGNVAKETIDLHSATHENYCPACKVDFINVLDSNVEVFFNVHPNIRKLDEAYKNIYLEYLDFRIRETGADSWKKEDPLYGIEIIQNNKFRDLIGEDTLIADQSLEILKVTVLFTDLKESTKLYNDLGDVKAFSLVREHFNILFMKIKEYKGVPIKTIGDAVMGVFLSEEDGIKASLDIQKTFIEFYKEEKKKLELKIGLHSGPALLVTLNKRLDYFGQSVNIAARIQSSALPNEVVLSNDMYLRNKGLFEKYADIFFNKRIFKGLPGFHKITHILLRKRSFKENIKVKSNRIIRKFF